MGVIKTIRTMLRPTHEVFICEMGAKKTGDIKEICDLVSPKFGLLTSIGPQHLETFKSVNNIISTKFELIDSLPEYGAAFLNFDNDYIRNKSTSKRLIAYGTREKGLQYWAEDISFSSRGSTFTFKTYKGQSIELTTKLLGLHNVLNIVAAGAVACELGMELESISFAVKLLKPVPHRLELKEQPGGVTVIDDAFNSNPEGAKAALEVLSKFESKNKILITPGMVELGDKEYEYNKEFGGLAARVCDYVILVGVKRAVPMKEGMEESNYPQDKLYVAKNLNDAINKMRTIAGEGSVVLFENDLPDTYNE